MKFTSKSKFRAIAVLFLALAVTVSCALWSVFGRRENGMEALANTTAAEIANALNGAAADWKTQTSVRVGDTSKSDEDGKGDDGCVVTISQATADVSSVVIPSGAQVTVDPIAPSVQRELENIATYTQIIFEVPVTVQAEAVLTLNADVVFCDKVTVEGTLIINGMAFNQGAMQVSNANNTHAEIKSEGVIVNGSLNNDAARGGSISIAAGATLTIGSGSGTEYADGTAAPDGGALFLKANTSNALGITNQGSLTNGGSVIFDENVYENADENADENAGAPSVSGEGVVQSAEFINEIPEDGTNTSKTYVFYQDPNAMGIEGYRDGTSLALSNESTKTWSNFTLLSFGRTVITNTGTNRYYTLTNVNLGGGTINVDLGGGTSGGTFTQGANELIFDGGARWVETGNQDEARQDVYDVHSLDANFENLGESGSVEDLRFFNGGEKGENYTNGSDGVYSSSPLMRISGSNVNLSVFGGVRLMHHETRGANGVGGAISVKKDAKLVLYGGDISYNAVTRSGNAGTGAGIYIDDAVVSVYGGRVSYNAIATYIGARIFYNSSKAWPDKEWTAQGSADGAGIAVDSSAGKPEEGSILNLYGGEISYNHGATGSTADPGADGGGLIARYSVVNMFDGKIQGNYAGGSGGGILLWDSELNMSGGSIANNRAAFGGGVGMTSDNVPKKSAVNISGGEIFENEAFYNNYINAGGYGGGICVGSAQYQNNSSATFSGSAVVFGNSAVYGGGLAVYTANNASFNYLAMSGGTVTGNTASANENGNGVYVTCSGAFNQGGGMLRLSGSASIDSSNNVSFNIPAESTAAPISVTGELTGSALAALVRLSNESAWANKNIVSFANENIVNRDKFLLDSTDYAFSRSSRSLTIGTLSASDPVARVGNAQSGQGYTTLEDAVSNAVDGQTIYILRGSMISRPIEINKNLAIVPYGGDYTLAVATDFVRTGYNNPAVFIINDGSLTLGNESGNRLIIDGNGTVSNGISLISVISGSYTQNAMVTLRNCNTTANGGAIFLNNAGASATIRGGIIENTIGAGGAIYVGNGASLTMTGGELRNNTDRDGNSYGIYLSNSQSVLTLNGAVSLSDDIYTEAVITVDSAFENALSDGKIGIATRSDWRAGQPLVDGTKYVTSADMPETDMLESLLNAFELVNMGKDYSLVTQSSDTSKTLVLSKAVTYIFDYGYEDGASQQNAVKPSYGDFDETIFDQLGQYNNGAFASRISTRGNRVVITVPWNSGTFDLSSLSLTNYATLTGHSIIRWQTADGGYNYNEGIGYTESSAEINVYAVWAENTYEITFDKNASAITGASSSDVKGEMGSQEIVYPEANEDEWTGNIDVNRFTAVGWKFSGWKNVADSSGTVFEDHADLTGTQLLALASGTPSRYEIQDGDVSSAVYTVTLQAQWKSIFGEGSGVGTSEGNAFILNSVNDLYILEATVFGPEADRNGKGEYSILNGYYNDNKESGEPDYTAEDYEGYYFKLGGDIGNADTPFTGVIGRVSTDPVVGGSHAGDDAQNHLDQEDQITNAVYGSSTTTGGNGAAAGTPFKGTFDGGGHTIYLNINKQKTTAGNAGATINDDYGTYTNGDETLTGVGLFGYIDHASIKNLELDGSVHGYSHVGALVGYAFGGTIEEVYNKATVTSGGHDVGGVIGTFYELPGSYTRSSVTNAANAGEVKYAPRENGDKSKKLDVEENWDELEIIDDAEGVRFGGIVGAGITLRLTGGYNAGNVTARYGVGGVVGTLRSLDDRTANDAFITQSFNIGTVTATSGLYAESTWTTGSKETLRQTFITAYTGGITGRLVGVSTVSNSFNGGTVTADFVAQITADTVSQESGYTVATAPAVGSTDSDTYLGARGVGGIVGFTSYKKGDSAGRIALSNVYNTGSVSAWAGVGGIAGYFAYANINEAFNGGNVTATGTHYDESARARVAGGYTVGNDSREVYVSYLGAIVGRGVSATLGATVSYNVNSSYKGYTDATVQAIGDSSYNADFGFTVNTDSAAGLTSAQMRVYKDHVLPSGFSQGFNTSGWDFLCYTPSEEDSTGGDNYSYYPQLSAFTGSKLEWTFSVTGSGQLTISKISRHYARIMYTEEGGEDKPIEDNIEFRLTFVLGGGAFAFDGEGEGNSFEGGSKIYTQVESNSDRYQYTFAYPQDDGATELETPKAPERVGYTFGGWYIDSTYTQEFDFGAIPGQNMVIYARWVPVSYRIDYLNVNDVGGSISGDYTNSFTVENAAGGRIVFPGVKDMFRRGYRFVEWQFGGEGNRQTVTSADVITSDVSAPTLRLYNGDKTVKDILFSELNNQTLYLYAVWAERTYNITYYLDEEAYSDGRGKPLGNVPEGFDKYTFGSQAFVLWSGETLNAQNPGYIFNGWKIEKFDNTDAQNNKNYQVGEQRSYLESGTVGDFVLVGNWTAVKYTLTFNLGIGSITPKTASKYGLTSNLGLYSLTLGFKQSLADGENAWSKFKPNPPTGYTFAGWYTGLNGTGKLVTLGDGSFTMPAADTTLYAHYTLNTYTVKVQIPQTVGTEVTVSIDGDKLADYGFTEGDHTEDHFVYTLQVSHGNGVEKALSALAAALQFGASGWHFTDWTVAWTDKEDENTPSIYRVTGALTVTANCNAERIVVNFVNQITGATIATETITAGSPVTNIPTFENPFGYTFRHWLYNGSEYTKETLKTVTFTASSTVYAVFAPAKVNATFYLGLDVEDPVPKDDYQYTFGERFGSFPTVKELEGRLGDEVVNWYVQKEDDSLQLVSADTLLTKDLVTQTEGGYSVVLRADIELYEYTVTVNSGAGGSVSGYTGTSYRYNYDNGAKVIFDFPVGYSASPNTGYELAGYLVNGEMVSCTDANAETAIAAHLLTEKITGNITITAQWKLKKYAVWFDAGENGHFVVDGSVEGVTFYKDVTTPVTEGEARYAVIIVEHNSPPDFDIVPERPGSSFSSWNYGGALNITSERSPANGNPITAYWTTEKYSIRYELDGGEPLAGNYQTFYQYGDAIDFTAPAYVPRRGGYSFLGWFDQAENGNKIESTAGKTGDLTLYAHWEVNTYALQLTISLPQGVGKTTIEGWFSAVKGISFIADNIVGNSITVWVYAEYGTSLTALNSVLKTIGNYVPKGWEYKGSAYYFSTMPESGTPLEFGEGNKPVNIGDGEVMQLTNSYASQENYHTITVYLSEEEMASGSAYTTLYVLSGKDTVAPEPTRTGYTVSGWMQSNAGGEATEFKFGNPLNADVVIYAKWAPNTYTVTFNGNGATSGTMLDQLLTYDNAEQALTQNEFSRTGYTFIGWATTPDGNVAYSDGKTTPNVTAENGGKVTLYAVWEANTYKIAFHYGNTSVKEGDLSNYGKEPEEHSFAYGANISFADAAIPHYSHVWYMWDGQNAVLFRNSTMPDLSDKSYEGYVTVGTGEEKYTYTIHLYAVYTAETYYIRYQSGEPTPVDVTMETETELDSAEPSLGYSFVGWELYTNGNSVSTGNYFNSFAVGEDEEGNIVVEFHTQSGNTCPVALGDLKSYTLVPHFEAIEYTIKFEGRDGATGSTASMSLSYGVTDTLQENEFKKNGYNFAGWALSDNTDSVAYADGASITITSGLVEGLGEGKTITLYAVWTPIEYTITYVLNGGTLNGEYKESYTVKDETFALETPADRTGYKFGGWFEKEDFSGDAVSEIAKGSTGNKVFYAKWKPESCAVRFAENSGTGLNLSAENALYGQQFVLTLTAQEGYTLPASVEVEMVGSSEGFYSYSNGVITISSVTGVITITANGVINRYTVTYVLNGGSLNEGYKASYTVEESVTLPTKSDISRTGYKFLDWFEEEGFSGSAVSEIAKGSTGNKVFYAKWDPIQYTVTFDANGGEGSLDAQTFTYDVAEELTNNNGSIHRTGYTFLGWATEKDSNSVAYSDGASVINLASTNDKTVELFAVWQINTYTLTFKLTLPEAATTDVVSDRMDQLVKLTLNDDIRKDVTLGGNAETGYTITVTITAAYKISLTDFINLLLQDSKFKEFVVEGITYTLTIPESGLPSTMPAESKEYSGSWTSDNVRTLIVYSDNGVLYATYYTTTDTVTINPDRPIKAGYTFNGWTASGGRLEGSIFTFAENGKTATLTAQWNSVTYTVQYAGEEAPSSPMEFTFDGENFKLEDGSIAELPSGLDRKGYTFGGWLYNDAVYTTLAELFEKTSLGDGYDASTTVIELTAVWNPVTYTVMFDANDGMGAVNPQTITIDDADGISLNANSFVYVGYDFQGWATSAQGEVVYSDGGNFTLNDGLIPAEGTIITLYAVWSVKVYTLSFDKNAATDGVTGNLDSQTAIYEAVESNKTPAYFTLPEELTRKGYTFLGWATEEGSNSAVYAGGAMVNANQLFTGLEGEGDRSRTLYAVWQVNIYTVTYELNGGTEGTDWIKSYTVKYKDGTFSLPQDATREGYTFEGWFSDAQFTGDKIASFSVSDAENKIFYAKWAAEKHTVTIDLGREGSIAELPDGAEGTEGSSGAWTKFTIKMDHDSNVYDLLDKLTVAVLGSPYQLHAGWQVTVGEGNLIALQGDITVSALYSQEQIIVTVVHADGSVSHVNVKYGETLEETDVFAPKTGYNYAGWYYGENVEFVFAGKGEATVITAPITLYPNATAETYDVTTSTENAVLVGGGNDVARYGQNYVFTFIAETGYSLSDIVLKMGERSLTEEEYSYDPTTGRVVIFSVTGNIEVSATVSARTYTVTFNANGGTLTGAERTDVTFGQPIGEPTEPTPPDGYTFAGWYYNGTAWDFETNTMPAGDITLVAQWERESYSVVFDNDGMKTEYTYLYGDTVTKPADPVKEGHAFLGWYNGEIPYDFAEKVTSDLTLTAMWQKNTYTVTFNANGGTDVAPQEVEYLGTAKEPAAPAREGYTFEGWYLNGTQWDFDEMSVTGDITLVALWSEIRYTVRFLDGDQLVAALTVTEKGTVTAPALGAREGYTFEGWFNGETRFDFDAPITDDVTLTAKWSAAEYTVSFETGGGTAVSDQTVVHGGKISVPQIPEREGYVFTGWYFNGTAWDFEEMTVSGGMTLVAGWKAREYTVTFDPNGGSAVAEQSVVYNGTATMPEQPVREGYVFEGWFSGETQFDFAAAITGDVTLTAKWSPRGYSISYVLGGGANAAGNPSGYTVESDTITLGAPTREGYTFAGWYDAEENGNLVTQIAAGSKGNITLYAAWQANSFEVDFVANGGTLDGADTQKVTAGGTVAYAEPVRENYLFVGWFTDEALTVRYDFKTPVTGNLTLYAKWRLQVVTGVTENGTVVTVSSDAGFDDGTQLHFVEVTDEDTVGSAAAHLRDNMTLARLFDIEIVDAGGAPVEITEPLSVGISVEGLSEAEGNWGVVYVPDGEGEIEVLATHVGDDGRLYFFVEHFSFYAVVDIAEIGAGFAWWWILVAVAGCALIALILVLVARSAHRYELNFVNGGVPAQKLKESSLIDLPLPEREEEAFEGWYFDEDFRDRATLTSMPKQNLILFAKWRKLTDEERAARDRARAEAAAMAEEGFHHAAPRQEKKHKENPFSEIKEDD